MSSSILVQGYEFPFNWADKLNQGTISFLEEIKREWTPTQGVDDLWHQTVYERILEYIEGTEEDLYNDPTISIGSIIIGENTFYENNIVQAINSGNNPEDIWGDLTQEHIEEYLKIIS